MKKIDIKNKKFGKITAISFSHKNNYGADYWNCLCDCGNHKVIRKTALLSKVTKSCGCLHKEIIKKKSTRHGFFNTKEYTVWHNIKQRIKNKNNNNYKHYGAKGITLTPEWEFFENFIKDMGKAPSENHSIDRIDVNLGYFKENCRWATREQQDRNTRRTKKITYLGKTQCIADWAKEYNINQSVLNQRIFKLNWELEKAFTKKVRIKAS